MAHPVVWPGKSFFYPIGNTPAVSLAQDLPPEESLQALLLGCGDPRHILFTLYNSGADTSVIPRTYDFTCCDIEAGVLARNVLLFSLIIENAPAGLTWDIFFHMRLGDAAHKLLIDQCHKLINYAKDLTSWINSPYGNIIRVCSILTLDQLGRQWALYASTSTYNEEERSAFRSKFNVASTTVLQKVRTTPAFWRSAGPLAISVMNSKTFSRHHTTYWKKGFASSEAQDNVSRPPNVNPTFAFSMHSGKALTVHYGTSPLQPFHFAAKLWGSSTTVEGLVASAQEQFKNWCTTFRNLSTKSPERLVVRVFIGDALAFGRALHYCATTSSLESGVFVRQWSNVELILDGGDYGPNAVCSAPLIFNVIDTSNLIDHLGLLNVIVAAGPLLARTPTSNMYTEAILSMTEDATTGFTTRMCMDLPVMGMFLGLIPTSSISNFTSTSNTHEVLINRLTKSDSPQYFERLSWKVPYSGDHNAPQNHVSVNRPIVFEPLELAQLVYEVYLKMFFDEDSKQQLRNVTHMGARGIVDSHRRQDLFHYVRGSLVMLIKFMKQRASTDWDAAMHRIVDLVLNDRALVMNMNNFQDLCCQLFMEGVHKAESYMVNDDLLPMKRFSRFEYWRDVPLVVCVVMIVPRSSLEKLLSLDPNLVGTPFLQCETIGTHAHAIYASFQASFGTVKVVSSELTGNPKIEIDEDLRGWEGDNPLIVSWWMPSSNLLIEPRSLKARLSLKSTGTTTLLIPKLGFELALHVANISDSQSIHILRERPGIKNQFQKSRVSAYGTSFNDDYAQTQTQTSFKVAPTVAGIHGDTQRTNMKVKTLSIRSNVLGEEAKKALTDGAQLAMKQISPCTVQLSYSSFTQNITFPFPIDGDATKLRIARKSSYLELVAQLSGNLLPGGYSLDQTPVLLRKYSDGHTPHVWNIHHLNLDRLPILKYPPSSPLIEQMLATHLSLSFSDREREIRENSINTGRSEDVLVSLKDTLFSILRTSLDKKGPCAFGISEKAAGGTFCLVLSQALRWDVGAQTIAAECFIVPLTQELVPRIGKSLGEISRGMYTIEVGAGERAAWQRLVPALVERSRQWQHKGTCEYLTNNRVPLSTEYGTIPICNCGRGLDADELKKSKDWKEFAPHATRVAISPLFAVSYLDTVAGKFPAMGTRESIKRNKACAFCDKPPGKKIRLCNGCERVCYCSPVCQKAHWPKHKADCNSGK